MELNINNFIFKNENDYFLLRTKNYHKTKTKYSKKKSLFTLQNVFFIKDTENYDEIFEDIIKKVYREEKLFIITLNNKNENLIFIYKDFENCDDVTLANFINSNDKLKNKKLKIIPIIYSDSKILNLAQTKHKPIIIGKKTNTTYTNNIKYFKIDINLYKSFLIRTIINGIKKSVKNMKILFGITIETKKEDNKAEELYAKLIINDCSQVFV